MNSVVPTTMLKRLADIRPSGVDKITVDGEASVRLCNYMDVYRNSRITGDLPFMHASASTAQIERFALRRGDVLITKDSETPDDIAVPAVVDASAEGILCGYHLALLRPRSGVDGGFLAWALRSKEVAAQFTVRAQGVTRYGLTTIGLGTVMVPMPEDRHQQTIAAFLDRETAKIDALVAEQERLLVLLEEKRQAVIANAVTKGLDPTVPMKDSGVEWLGQVPAHWLVGSLKRFWTVIDCKHVTAEFVPEGRPLASIKEVQGRFVNLDDAQKTTERCYDLLIEGGRLPKAADLIFSRNATVGEVAQVAAWHPLFAMGQDVCLLRRNKPDMCPDYMQNVLRSRSVSNQLALCMIGSTFKRVNIDQIKDIVVPMPSAGEQQEISLSLSKRLSSSAQMIIVAQNAISLLQERRAALISAAVTGKLDLRTLAPAAE